MKVGSPDDDGGRGKVCLRLFSRCGGLGSGIY